MIVLGLVLLLAATVGNTALLSFSLNWWYARPLHKYFLHAIRLFHALLVVVVPLAFWLVFGLDAWAMLSWPEPSWDKIGRVYFLLCLGNGLLVTPLVTIVRLWRREPVVVASNHTQTIDLAARLGSPPEGDGKYRLATRLPGNQVFRVDFADRTLLLPQLPPAWDGLTILHLTDLHFYGTPSRDFFKEVMAICSAEPPDLVAVTGDLVDGARYRRWIIPILGRLRFRIAACAVLGNHDQWYDPAAIRRRLRRVGFRVLDNSWERIDVRGQPLTVIGNETPWFRPAPDLSACPPGFRLCLSHSPDNFYWAKANGIDLVLAGHNHGGQIRFPVIGSVFVPSRYGRHFDCGTFQAGSTVMHVGRGLSGKQPLRFNCRPEVTRLILRRP